MRFGKRRYLICIPEALVVAQYFGIEGSTLGSICMRYFNPKYWATRHSAVDIASRQNALAPVRTEN
jgi:hypothetical protein